MGDRKQPITPPIIPDEEAVSTLRRGGTVFVDLGDRHPVEVMAVPACANCRYWTAPGCEGCSEDYYGWGECMKADGEKAACTHDGYFLTAPDFGCVQWEAK